MRKNVRLLANIIALLTGVVGCGLLNPANLASSGNREAYPKASEDANIVYQLQSNKPRTHFFIDGKEMGVARHLKVYINNQAHTITAQAEGCNGKEEYVQPPYNSITPLGFTYLMGECDGSVAAETIAAKPSEPAKVDANTHVKIYIGDKTPPEIKIINYQSRAISETDKEDETIQGQATDKNGVASVTMNGKDASLDENGNFSADILLKVGLNIIRIVALDTQGNQAEKNLKLKRSPAKEETENAVATPENLPANLMTGDYGKYFALVIGNNDYQFVPKLDTAENDAKEVARVLQNYYGFNTKILLNATRKDILDALNDFRLKLNADDNLVIYYAGHGVKDVSAYWLPIDAKEDSTTEWIQAETITTELKKINSNHVLIISDSCYSGELSRSITPPHKQGSRDFYLKKLFSKKSRTLIASGGNEPVADAGGGNHSIFTKVFIEALINAQDTVFTDDELFNKNIKEIVAGSAEQTPQYSALKNSGHEDGSFIFVKKK
jgi:Caspase domain/Glucodextranase, domain B